jgi:cytoskeletal protein RodZ
MPKTLGDTLKMKREMKRLSLMSVAGPADISATYLQKLERGEVQDPSPHVLHRLSEQLDLDYNKVMKLAGYVVPTRGRAGARPISHALSSEPLTSEEEDALTEYLTVIRQRERKLK